METPDARQAFREWAREKAGPFNDEDAYRAGFEFALRWAAESAERMNNPVVRSLREVLRRCMGPT